MTEAALLLRRLATVVARDPARAPLTGRLCFACRDLLGADSASITVETTTPNRVMVGATDDRARRLEDLQDVTGEGPSIDAFVSGAALIVTLNEAAIERWPLFGPAARDAVGELKIYAFPMRPGTSTLGTVSLLLLDHSELREDLASAQFLTDAVGAALLKDPLAHGDPAHSGSWSERSQVHQATGMVVAQLGVSTEDALALLRAHAFALGMGLTEVASKVIGRELDLRTDR